MSTEYIARVALISDFTEPENVYVLYEVDCLSIINKFVTRDDLFEVQGDVFIDLVTFKRSILPLSI